MKEFDYLIIGGGMTADSAVRGIRESDSHGTIGLISADSSAPYDRPPLTKGLWKGKELESIWRHTEAQNVEMLLRRKVTDIDLSAKRVSDDQKKSLWVRKVAPGDGRFTGPAAIRGRTYYLFSDGEGLSSSPVARY